MKFGSQKNPLTQVNNQNQEKKQDKNNGNKKLATSEIIQKYREAGEIAKGAKELARKVTKPGVKVMEVCEKIEEYIKLKGGLPAFPVNVSINSIAAHYSAYIADNLIIPKNSVVKVDLGVHIDGFIVDTAITIYFSKKYDDLVKASKAALDAVINNIKPGIKLSLIGEIAEKTITDFGFRPIKNLFGHQIKRYNLHAGLSIPSTKDKSWYDSKKKIEAGKIYAIEPFATTGVRGLIDDGPDVSIFRFIATPQGSGVIINKAKNYLLKTGILPFSPRWLAEDINSVKEAKNIMKDLKILENRGIVYGYHTLVDVDEGVISQHEHTIRTTKTGVEVLT